MRMNVQLHVNGHVTVHIVGICERACVCVHVLTCAHLWDPPYLPSFSLIWFGSDWVWCGAGVGGEEPAPTCLCDCQPPNLAPAAPWALPQPGDPGVPKLAPLPPSSRPSRGTHSPTVRPAPRSGPRRTRSPRRAPAGPHLPCLPRCRRPPRWLPRLMLPPITNARGGGVLYLSKYG